MFIFSRVFRDMITEVLAAKLAFDFFKHGFEMVRNRYIFKQKDLAQNVYIVFKGEVCIFRDEVEHKKREIDDKAGSLLNSHSFKKRH
jgi:CRP-like cAMP-binding protein